MAKQYHLPMAPIVEWDCTPGAKGVCLCLDCPDNMIGYEQKANGTMVVGGGSGESIAAGHGVSIPRRDRDGKVLRIEDVDALLEQAASIAVRVGERLYERLGTTCKRDLPEHEGLTQEEVGESMGITRQAAGKLERNGLRKLRGKVEVLDATGGVESRWLAAGCRRR